MYIKNYTDVLHRTSLFAIIRYYLIRLLHMTLYADFWTIWSENIDYNLINIPYLNSSQNSCKISI